jgi:hypothetical protein
MLLVTFLVTLLLVCRYPHALFFLELLQSEEFRTALASSQVKVGVAWPGTMRTCCDMRWQFAATYMPVTMTLSKACVTMSHRS